MGDLTSVRLITRDTFRQLGGQVSLALSSVSFEILVPETTRTIRTVLEPYRASVSEFAGHSPDKQMLVAINLGVTDRRERDVCLTVTGVSLDVAGCKLGNFAFL